MFDMTLNTALLVGRNNLKTSATRLKGWPMTRLELHNCTSGRLVVVLPSWCNDRRPPASAARGAGHAAEVIVDMARPSFTTSTLVFLTLFVGTCVNVQRFLEQPVDVVARLGDTVSRNMSAPLPILSPCHLSTMKPRPDS